MVLVYPLGYGGAVMPKKERPREWRCPACDEMLDSDDIDNMKNASLPFDLILCIACWKKKP